MRKGRTISISDDQHMQGKGDLCDLRFSQLCCWKCKLRGMWCYVIWYVGLDISRAIQCFKTSGNTHLDSRHHIPEELILPTWLGAMPHLINMCIKVLPEFSLPWWTLCSLVGLLMIQSGLLSHSFTTNTETVSFISYIHHNRLSPFYDEMDWSWESIPTAVHRLWAGWLKVLFLACARYWFSLFSKTPRTNFGSHLVS